MVNDIQQSLDITLAALGEPNRRAIVDRLADGALTPSALAEDLGLSGPALSKHLRVLRNAGVVSVTADAADARVRRYELQAQSLAGVHSWIGQLQQAWADQL